MVEQFSLTSLAVVQQEGITSNQAIKFVQIIRAKSPVAHKKITSSALRKVENQIKFISQLLSVKPEIQFNILPLNIHICLSLIILNRYAFRIYITRTH